MSLLLPGERERHYLGIGYFALGVFCMLFLLLGMNWGPPPGRDGVCMSGQEIATIHATLVAQDAAVTACDKLLREASLAIEACN